jgi:uncharacterized protein (UPF0335 family)
MPTKATDDFDLETNTSTKPKRKLKKLDAPKEEVKKQAKAASNRPDASDAMGDAARKQLGVFVARIERLEEEKAGIAADIKEVYAEAKSFGYDTKVLRKVIAERKKDEDERDEQQALFDLYYGAVQGYLAMEGSDLDD